MNFRHLRAIQCPATDSPICEAIAGLGNPCRERYDRWPKNFRLTLDCGPLRPLEIGISGEVPAGAVPI